MSAGGVIPLHRGTPFALVARAVEALGWARDPDRTAVDPVEPAFASWSLGFDGEMEYTRDAATGLGVLRARGRDAADSVAVLRRTLPLLGIGDAAALLQSSDPADLRLGIGAAREMRALPLLPAILPLRAHADPDVTADAAEAAAALLPAAGVEWLRRERAETPGRSALFPRLGDALQRRQIVRWLIHDRREANAHVLEVLRAALVDEDWEVRLSACLAAARLGAHDLWKEVRKAEVPRTSREGLDAFDRDVLLTAREAAAERIAGKKVPSADAAAGDSKSALRGHVARCVAGEPPVRHDRIFLLLHALATPVPPPEPSPNPFSQRIAATEEEGRYQLADGTELAWVPPVPHWLGDGLSTSAPVRYVVLSTGFFVAVSAPEEALTAAEARRRCEELSARHGLSVSLPAADEWEMAARGPDGRRFPWGNGYEPGMLERVSPWRLEGVVGREPQWTEGPAGLVLRGGPSRLRCAEPGVDAGEGERAAMRVVVRH